MMKDSIKDFIGTILVLVEFIGFILLIGTAGGVDQDMISLCDGYKRFLIIGVAMIAAGLALRYVIKYDDRD